MPADEAKRANWSTHWRWLRSGRFIQFAGRCQALLYGGVALLHVWWAVAPPSFVGIAFSLHMTAWASLFAVMAYVCRRVARNDVLAIYVALVVSFGLFLFAGSVLVGLNSYDGAGGVSNPEIRWPVYSSETALAFLSFVLNGIALYASSLLSWVAKHRVSVPA